MPNVVTFEDVVDEANKHAGTATSVMDVDAVNAVFKSLGVTPENVYLTSNHVFALESPYDTDGYSESDLWMYVSNIVHGTEYNNPKVF